MGLLDGFMPQQNPYGANDDQQKAALLTGLLSAGFGALTGRRGAPLNTIGRAGLLGLGGYSGALDSAQSNNMRMAQLEEAKQTGLLNRENLTAQLEERKRQMAEGERERQILAGVRGTPTMLAGPMPSGFALPPVENAPGPRDYAEALINAGLPKRAEPYISAAEKLAPKTQVVGEKIYENRNGQWVEAGGPGKQVDAWSEPYQMGGATVQRNDRTGEIRTAVSRPPVTNVNLPKDDKSFDREDKLRNDYNANPKVKAAAEMDSAFKLIESAYKNPTPANDLAMATKYMKILDPTSVVRESEFGMAVNATGLWDKVTNYSQALLEGKKLNPAQRKDFYESAKAINATFQSGVADVNDQFSEMAKGYGLNPQNVIPSLRRRSTDNQPPAPGSPTGAPKRIVVDY